MSAIIAQNIKHAQVEDPIIIQIEDIIARFVQNGDKRIEVRRLADEMGYSADHLSRRFRKLTGQALSVFMRERLLTLAHQQVVRTNRPIAEIAAAVGYRSVSHFTKAFKAMHGCVPSALRDSA